MRIISDFRDYYDCIKATDREQFPLYIRKMEIIRDDFPYIGYENTYHIKSFEIMSIWVCGKWFHPILVRHVDTSNWKATHDFVYTIEEADKFVESMYSKKKIEWYYTMKRYSKDWRRFKNGMPDHQILRHELMSNLDKFKSSQRRIDLEVQQPIVAYAYGKTVANPNLSHYKLIKVLDPYTCYQEIRMFIDGILCNSGKPIPYIDDKTLAEAKGFDKWSFRKEPKYAK